MTTTIRMTLAKEEASTPRSSEKSFEDCSASNAMGAQMGTVAARCLPRKHRHGCQIAPLHPVNLLRKHRIGRPLGLPNPCYRVGCQGSAPTP